MPQIIGCPDPQALKAFALGEGPSAWEDLAEHIEACAKCLAALKTLSAEDTLVDAVRAPETAPNVDQEFVRRLVGKVRSLLPASGRRAEQCAATPASGAGDETLAHEAESIEDVAGADGFAPPQEPDEIGRLAGYRVLKLLGVGGMGKVYMAEDAQLRRRVALKVMSATLARNPKARRRFVQEARLAAAIDHDHIVHIYQVGEDRGVPFLAMQLLSGVSLEDLLKRQGGLKVKQILRISAQVAEGLAAAHERDLIHRDIKPANIWIEPTGGGRAKILDFGLARNTAEDISLTQTGAIMGTPAYMAPEQARGEKVDHRCDLYSLGCVMYRMATGDLPIKGNDTMAMLMALVLHEPTPPVQLREDVPQALSDLIMALLAKEKEKRPASAKELVNALKNIERSLAGVVPGDTRLLSKPAPALQSKTPAAAAPPSPPPPVKPEPAPIPDSSGHRRSAPAPTPTAPAKTRPATAGGPRSYRTAVLLGAVAAGALGVLIAAIVFFIPTAGGVIRIEVDDPKISFKVDDKGDYVLVGAEGKELSFAAGEHALKFKHGDMEFETDKFTLKKSDRVVVKVELLKGKLQVISNDKALSEKKLDPPAVVAVGPGTALPLKKATWTPDKSVIAISGLIPHPALIRGVGRWQVIPAAAPEAAPFADSPDGRWVAVWGPLFVQVYDAKTGALAAVGRPTNTPGLLAGAGPSVEWSPDSKWFRTGHQRGAGWDNIHIFSVDGALSPAPWIQHAESDFGWNPKYPLLACMFHGLRDRIQLVDPAQAKPAEILTNHGSTGKAAWSPDGEWLVVVREDKTAQLFGRDGKAGAKLEGAVEPLVAPVWSADSKRIAALTSASEVRFWSKDGAAGATTGKHDTPVRRLWWHPDGKLFAAAEDTKLRFWKADGAADAVLDVPFDPALRFIGSGFIAQGKHWPTLAKDAKAFPAWLVSPDGTSAVTGNPRVAAALGMAEIKGTELTALDWRIPYTGIDTPPRFSLDGKLFFVNDIDGLAAYDVRDCKKVVRFGRPTAGQLLHLVLAPKGDRLALGSAQGHITICDPNGQPIPAAWQPLKFSDDPAKASVTHPGCFRQLAWHPDGRHLLAVQGDGAGMTVALFDTVDGKQVTATKYELERFNPHFFALFAPDDPDTIIFMHSGQSALWRWKLERAPASRFDGFLGQAYVSPDHKALLSRVAGKNPPDTIPVLVSTDLKTRTPFPELASAPEKALAWLADGKHFLAPTNPLSIRSLDGKLVDEIPAVKEVDTSWTVSWTPAPDRKSLLGRAGNQCFLLDLAAKKLAPLPQIKADNVVFSPDGKRLIGASGSTLLYWNYQTKELEQIVLLLPEQQFAVFSPAGEVLARSKDAERHYRYVVEDKTGRLHLQTSNEFVKGAALAGK